VSGLRRSQLSRSLPSCVWGQTVGRGLVPRCSPTAADAPAARQGWVPLGLLAGLGSLAFAPEFPHPGANGGEVISNAGPVHGVSSHIRFCFDPGDRAGGGPSGCNSQHWLTPGRRVRLTASGPARGAGPSSRPWSTLPAVSTSLSAAWAANQRSHLSAHVTSSVSPPRPAGHRA
jgi:hypothetical protein